MYLTGTSDPLNDEEMTKLKDASIKVYNEISAGISQIKALGFVAISPYLCDIIKSELQVLYEAG